MIITEDLALRVEEIRRLLAEAYEHYFEFGDGHCKSSEGAVSIHLSPFFWREVESADEVPGVEVYSYVLGPHRQHYFKNADIALATVREWHAEEMSRNYEEDSWGDDE